MGCLFDGVMQMRMKEKKRTGDAFGFLVFGFWF